MTDEDITNDDRRTVLKTLAATGLAGAGIAGASGSAAAQGQGKGQGQGGSNFRRLRFDVERAGTFDTGEYEENVPSAFTPGEDATFDGELVLEDIEQNDADELVASGRLRGTLSSNPTEQINETFEVVLGLLEDVLGILSPDEVGECPILELVIEPIFLDLLGLQLTTETIDIDLTAVAGQGNLLGNLLCAVAGLLDP
ncbi:hypothetical protein CV102_00560 [Natronococcus pandeyae]|uniref:Uncharacterized protein n=1 Tax=Natronococcus pandeyae TaxID=2055836 RepID=A0A8J8Q7I3_9EURY|nr:hypothetical protein [Natronococcus pandeyae]TYL40108.1 hypothetical protein CV102_00560 [Natronococcus pandeyae]